MMNTPAQVIEQTKKWIIDVVIGCNFCPFAARELKLGTIHYEVATTDPGECVAIFLNECKRLDEDNSIETSFLIFPDTFKEFEDYLALVEHAEKLIEQHGYEGVYQVASFHPLYRFAGAPENDAANYTNRSPYPMLHLLREATIEKALEKYHDPDSIPERNIRFAREQGEAYMKMLRDSCIGSKF